MTLPPEIARHLEGFPVVIEQRVAWGEMDAFQHLNNVVYFRYMENGRIAYVQRLGWWAAVQAKGVYPILSEATLRFRRPVVFPDTLYVGTRMGWAGSDRLALEHRMVSVQRGEITTEGTGVVVAYDYTALKKAAVPDDVRRAIEKLEGKPSAPPPA